MKKILWVFTLVLAGMAAADAEAALACEEEWGDLDSYELDGSDLALHSKAPGNGEAWGKAGCIFWSDETLLDFRLAAERDFRAVVEKNFAAHAKYGQFDAADYACRFEDTRGLAGEGSFEKPAADTELRKALLSKTCGGSNKRSHYAFVEIPLRGAAVKLRCGSKEKMREWEDRCGHREPASVKPVKTKPKKSPVKKK